MSFLHSHSSECMTSQLDIFSIPPTQTSIESSDWIEYLPISSINESSPIQFVIPAGSENYIDLSMTKLRVKVCIQPSQPTKEEDLVSDRNSYAPINNLMHSLFSQIDISLNQKTVSSSNNTYPYRSYIETLLSYGYDSKNSFLSSVLFYPDTPGKFESQRYVKEDVKGTSEANINYGLQKRYELTKDGVICDMIGHLHCDLFNQDKFLINGVEMGVRLIRSKDSFCLMQPRDAIDRKVIIKDIALLVRRVKVSPTVLINHAKSLSQTTAKYPISRVEVKSFILHSGINNETLDNIIIGQIPKNVIIGFVENAAFNGSKQMNPFNFQHIDLNFFGLSIDGHQVPRQPLQPSFSLKNYIAAYDTLFSGTGVFYKNEGNLISREDYNKGLTLYAYDLTPDLSAHTANHWNLTKQGTMRLELGFEKPLAKTFNCIVYVEYDNIMEIDSSRQVILDYTC